ncbi:putative Torsin-1A-interacting protein 1 [Daphnia magna]|uniref:Putative Torsin-1A-interacting protein 1 n=1 Tax=Daphnia magna TaxID=35525 RepID=A0A0P5TSJ0_9CRUS|nr:putative Torsin-1A-interacting protein 1 [Daphnia magna]
MNYSNCNLLLVFQIVFISASLPIYFVGQIVCLWSFFFNPEETRISATLDSSSQINKLLDEMQSFYPLQKKATWISFLAALNSVIEEEPSQPAVLLFVGRNATASKHTMQCLALTLAVNVNKLLHKTSFAKADFPGVTVKVDEIADLLQQDDTIKQELDEQIYSVLSQSFSVVLGPLEKIPPRAALLLHGYCDNFMAPFKKRVVILTATFDFDISHDSKQLEQKLHNLWYPTLGIDKSASIVSRVANNVVFIEPETTLYLHDCTTPH